MKRENGFDTGRKQRMYMLSARDISPFFVVYLDEIYIVQIIIMYYNYYVKLCIEIMKLIRIKLCYGESYNG